jgi:hypothetical protein
MPTKKAVKVTTGLTIQGFKQYDPPEFRSKAGRLVARGVPVVEAVAPAGISLTPPLLCFLESDMAKRNMVPIGPAVPIENEQLLAAKRRAKLHPFDYKAGLLAHACYPSEHIQKYHTKEDVPVEVEEIERGISLGFSPDRPRWYVSSVDAYMNGEPVVITEKAKPTRKRSTGKA